LSLQRWPGAAIGGHRFLPWRSGWRCSRGWLGYTNRPPLQAIYLVVGAVIVVVGISWQRYGAEYTKASKT
jgi:hypothetical protein